MTDSTAPVAPTISAAVVLSPTAVQLRVDTPYDAVGVTAYKVYNSGVLLQSYSGAAPPSIIDGLTANTAYVLTVTALDAALNESQPSNKVTVTTRQAADRPATSSVTGVAGVRGQCEIDFGTTPVSAGTFVISDPRIDTTSRIIAQVAYEAPTNKDLDEVELDALSLICAPGVGQFTMHAKSIDGSYVADKFKVNYTIQ